MVYAVHPELLGCLNKAFIFIAFPVLPGSAIGDFIMQQPFTHIGMVPSG